jgi:hypothetical protein
MIEMDVSGHTKDCCRGGDRQRRLYFLVANVRFLEKNGRT